MPSFDGLCCTDEAVALACTQDFAAITPAAWRVAQGTDATAAGLVFTSVGCDFASAGVVPGMMLVIRGETSRVNNEMLAIAEVAGKVLTLRRMGLEAGVGLGPVLKSGKTAFDFEVPTCHSTIVEMTRRLSLRYRLAAPVPVSDDLKCAAVEMVLCELYGMAHQLAGMGQQVADNFYSKYKQHLQRRDECLAVLDSLFGIGSAGDVTAPSKTRRRPAIGFTADQTDWPLDNGLWDR